MKKYDPQQHHGPHPGIMALLFTILFNAGLFFVISLSGKPPYYPGPWESQRVIEDYFQHHQQAALFCAFFQFAAMVPLGLLTASLVSRLRFLGNTSAGPFISLAGGFVTAVNLALSSLLLWTMAYPDVASNGAVLRMLYYAVFAIGGVGYSVPLGLLIAGVAVSARFMGILPRWVVISGIVVAAFGEISTLSLVYPGLLALIPLTRFPGFVWLIIVGFKLPGTRHQARTAAA